MATDNAKHTGLVVALGMPPPNKLKKSMMGGADDGKGDEGESDAEAQDEMDSGKTGGGEMALKDMWTALKTGDTTAAWDAFCDAQKICAATKGKGADEGAGDEGGEGDSAYGGE
jgi:hypothetical protein